MVFVDEMKIVFVDWAPIKSVEQISNGSQIRRYYAWSALNKLFNRVTSFRKTNNMINLRAVLHLFKKDSIIWVEYGCGGVAHFFVILSSLIKSNKKKIILNVHDFTIEQQRDTYKGHSTLKSIRLQIIERLIFNQADILIIPSPGFLCYFVKNKKQKVIIMAPGLGEDDLSIPLLKSDSKSVKIKECIDFGSIRKKGIIPNIIKSFSGMKDFKLTLIGQKEGAKIEESENVMYLGTLSHPQVLKILDETDIILISLPKNEYINRTMQIRLAYALKPCKPVIASNLWGIVEYLSMVGLKENVILLDDWNTENIREALHKAQRLHIDAEKTIEKLRKMAWEPRFEKVIEEIILKYPQKTSDIVEWI